MDGLGHVGGVHAVVVGNVQVVGLEGQQVVDELPRGDVEGLQKVALLEGPWGELARRVSGRCFASPTAPAEVPS